MRVLFRVILMAGACAAGWAGCGSPASGGRTTSNAPAFLEAEAASAAGISAEQANDAHRLYVARCARCHKFYNPRNYSDAEWQSWMTKMSKKARLTAEQAKLLSSYLGAYRTAKGVNAEGAEN